MIYAAYTITYTIASLLIGRKLYDKWNAYNSSVAGYEAERSFKNKTWKYERVPTLAVTLYIPIGAVLLWDICRAPAGALQISVNNERIAKQANERLLY